LVRSGLSVIPLCWPDPNEWGVRVPAPCGCGKKHGEGGVGKAPLLPEWSSFMTRRPNEEEVDGWAQAYPGCNWGIVCGHVSGVIVLDFDDTASVEWWEANVHPLRGHTLCISSGSQRGGLHAYYAWQPGVPSCKLSTPDGKLRLCEVRSESEGPAGQVRCQYVVSPGSRHRDGTVYSPVVQDERWAKVTEGELDPCLLPPPPPEVLEFIKQRRQAAQAVYSLGKTLIVGDISPTEMDWARVDRSVRAVLADETVALKIYPSRSEAIFGVIGKLGKAGWNRYKIKAALLESPWAHRDRKNPEEYFDQEIDRWFSKHGYDPAASYQNGAEEPSSNGTAARLVQVDDEDEDYDDFEVVPDDPAPEYPTANEQLYYGLAGDFVQLVEPHTEADPVAILAQFLAGFGNVVGAACHLRLGPEIYPPRLFVAVVGESSKGRKGTSLGWAIHPLRSVDPTWSQTKIVYSGLESGEGVVWHVRDRRVTDKGKADPGVEDKRLFVVEEELVRVLQVISREGNTLSAVLRNAWDGRILSTLTKHDPVKATGAHISIVCHITLDELRKSMPSREVANGFANRFLWIFARRTKLQAVPSFPDEDELQDVTDRIAEAARFASSIDGLSWSESAHELWVSIYPDLSAPRPGMLGDVLNRAESQVLRLAVVYALLDRSPSVTADHLQAALSLWNYCVNSSRVIWDEAARKLRKAILRYVRAVYPHGLLRRSLHQQIGGHVKAEELDEILQDMEEAGLIHHITKKPKGRGRPGEWWYYGAPKP
jgi:hypothetical protein